MPQSGHIKIVETLYGPSIGDGIDFDNTDVINSIEQAWKSGRPYIYMSHEPLTVRMRTGQYWLLTLDSAPKARRIFDRDGIFQLSGLDSPVLAMYRQYRQWDEVGDIGQLLDHLRKIVLDQREEETVRIVALEVLEKRIHKPYVDAIRYGSATAPPATQLRTMERMITQLLSLDDLPREMRRRAMGLVTFNPKNETANPRDDLLQLRYVLNVFDHSRDYDMFDSAADVLVANSTLVASKTNTYYYFPEVIDELQKWANSKLPEDTLKSGTARRALVNISLAGFGPVPEHVIVLGYKTPRKQVKLTLPQFADSDLGRKLRAGSLR
jgi:hypothetical protein